MLEIKNINVFYRDLQALWDVSLTVNKGEIVTLVGSNGAGKSTILNTVAGLLKPRGGNIFFDGKRIDNLPAHRVVEKGISMIPEGRRLFPLMTVLDNLEVGASVAEARSKRHSSIGRVFELFPVLKQRAGQNASTLSGGEQQMLAIGRALMASPRLLLIDEMSLGLSPILVLDLYKAIRAITESQDLTVLLVEQDIGLALSMSGRGYVLENGRIVSQGEAKTLLSNKQIREAYLGTRSK